MKKIGVFDLGTSSLKVSVFDPFDDSFKKIEFPYPTYNENGLVIQYTKDWEDAFRRGIEWIDTYIGLKNIEAFSFTGQMEDLILKDKVILYSDTSGREAVEKLNALFGEEKLYKILGNHIDSMMPLTKLYLLKEKNKIDTTSKILLGGKDYLIYLLTGKYVTDPTNASTTGLYNIREKKWDEELLKIIGLDQKRLPKIYPPHTIIGETSKKFGLPKGIKIINGIGDAGASAIGMNIEKYGASIYLGTTGWITIVMNSLPAEGKKGIFTLEFINNKYLLIGAPLNVGKAYEFLKTLFGDVMINSHKKKHLPVFLPYLSGERSPFTDPEALASWIGMDENTTKEELIFSAMEGVCFSLYHTACTLLKDKIPPEILLTGGVTKNDTWCELFSNTFDSLVIIPEIVDSPTIGAYIIAKKRLYQDIKEVSLKRKKIFTPKYDLMNFHKKRFEIYKNLYPILKDTYHI